MIKVLKSHKIIITMILVSGIIIVTLGISFGLGLSIRKNKLAYSNVNISTADLLLASTTTSISRLNTTTEACSIDFQPITFYNSTTFYGAQTILTGDFNNDNISDVLVAVYNDQILILMLGKGNGTFQASRNISSVPRMRPDEVAIADINHDNQLDIITFYQSVHSLGVFLGNGNGTFRLLPVSSLPELYMVNQLSLAYLNGDSHLDLMIGETAYNRLVIFPGFGDGTFGDPTYLSTSESGWLRKTVIGDFNNDTYIDLITIVDVVDTIFYFRGNGNESYHSPILIPLPFSLMELVADDINNDKMIDLILFDHVNGTLYTLFGQPDGTFLPPVQTVAANVFHYNNLFMSDLNKDHQKDIIFINYLLGMVAVAIGNINGTFEEPRFYSAGTRSIGPIPALAADFNGDHNMDIALINTELLKMGILFGIC